MHEVMCVPNNLLEALKMDLDVYPLKGQIELKKYTRWLLGEAYMCKEGDTNTHKYARAKGFLNVNSEIRSMIYGGNLMLDYDDLLQSVADIVVENHLKQKNQNDEVKSFNEVMSKTLSYYQEKFNAKDKNEVINFAKIILSNYFNSNHINVFSSKNGTRAYVSKKTKEQILGEISKELKMVSSVPDAIISVYANKVATDWMLKENVMNNSDLSLITNEIINKINDANLNDKQKEYLISEFQNGNVDVLQRYVPKELINRYNEISSSLNNGYSK